MTIFGKKSVKESISELDQPSSEIQPTPESQQETLPSGESSSQGIELRPAKPEDSKSHVSVSSAEDSSTASVKDESEELKQIEHVLEEDISEAFSKMDQQHQAMFKRAGEETAQQIEGILHQTKIKVQKIFELVKVWLQMIPGVNKWFIVQESKIKTDKIMRLKKE